MIMPKLSSVRSPEYTVFGVNLCFPALLLHFTVSRASRTAAKEAETAVPILLGLQWASPHVGGVSVNPEVKGDLALVPLPVWLTLALCL